MRTLEYGQTTYKVSEQYGIRILWEIVRPLPKKKNNGGQYAWDDEERKIAAELRQIGISYDKFEFVDLTTFKRVKSLITKYHEKIESLPISSFDPVPNPAKGAWSEKDIIKDINDLNAKPNRLCLIGKIAYALLPEAKALYPVKLGDPNKSRYKPMNLYQCTCGRYIAVPSVFKRPQRGFNSCGCVCSLYADKTRRTRRERILDAFREWTTIKLACFDERCIHYNDKNELGIKSFYDFLPWYEKQVRGRNLDERFVARKNKNKPFSLDNLKIINKTVDIDNRTGYIKL